MNRKFILGDLKIEFNEEFTNYNDLKRKFSEISIESYKEYINTYETNCLNMDDVHNKALDIGYSCISKNIDEAISILISNNLMSIDKKAFTEIYYSKFINWVERFEIVDSRYRRLVLTDEQEKEYRDDRKGSRGKWQGGGFGMEGAIKGAMDAGVMNLAEGAAHSIFNSVGNAITTANTNSEKEKLFKNRSTIEDLASGVMENVFNIHYAIVDALRINGNNTIDLYVSNEAKVKSGALSNNLKTGFIPLDKQGQIINDIIKFDPYNKSVYVYMIEKYGDANGEIEQITNFLDLDLKNEINDIVDRCYKNLPKTTESQTLESLEKFKEFVKSINIIDIQKYLNDFEIILNNHDIEIRTVDGILFDTREEACLAAEEYNEIIAIKDETDINSEKSINLAINKIENKDYKTSMKDKHLGDLNKKLIDAIRFEENMFLDNKYSVSKVLSEEEADRAIRELKVITLRNMDLLEKRVIELEEKRKLIIEEKDRAVVEDYFSTVVILDEKDIQKEVDNIRKLNIRTEKFKEEKIGVVTGQAKMIIKKHNQLLENAIKYEIRNSIIKEEKKVNKKGVFGFISKAVEKGSNFIDGIQEKKEKEAWNFITNNGVRTIESIKNRV